jgi:hypothetical protein
MLFTVCQNLQIDAWGSRYEQHTVKLYSDVSGKAGQQTADST